MVLIFQLHQNTEWFISLSFLCCLYLYLSPYPALKAIGVSQACQSMLTEKKSKKTRKNKKKPLEFLFIMNINKTSKESQCTVKAFHQRCCVEIAQTSEEPPVLISSATN